MGVIFRDPANREMNYSCMHFEFDRMFSFLSNKNPGHIHIFVSNSETYLTFRLVIVVFIIVTLMDRCWRSVFVAR